MNKHSLAICPSQLSMNPNISSKNQGGFLPLLKTGTVSTGKSDGFPSAFKICSPLPCQFHDEMGFLPVFM